MHGALRDTYSASPVCLLMTIMLLIFRIAILDATGQCHKKERTIGGMYLSGYMIKIKCIGLCWVECYFSGVLGRSHVSELQCVVGQKICKLINRIKEASPKDFIPDEKRFYMKRSGSNK